MNKLLDALEKHGMDVVSARDATAVVGWLDTGNYALNWAVGGRFSRGYPLGHVVEIFGDPGSGKTFLALRAVAEIQALGGQALYDDTEHALNTEWAEQALGVDPDRLVWVSSSTVEDHFKKLMQFADATEGSKEKYLFVLDSLGELTTEHEKEVGLEKVSMSKAKKLHAMFRLVGEKLSQRPVVYIVTNHVYNTIGLYSMPVSSGGKALKYKASVRLGLKSVKKIKGKGEITGVFVRAKVEKNRFTSPFKEVELTIPFNRPISKYSGLIPVLLELGIITAPGRTIVFTDADGKECNTGVFVQKSDPLKQEVSAEMLITQFPGLLNLADNILAKRSVSGSINEETILEE